MNTLLHISPEVATRFPHYRGLVLVADGLENGPSNDASRQLLRNAEDYARHVFANQPISEHPHLQAWREAYRAFGVKPQRMMNSAEALLSRVLKGGELPAINRLVDAYNAVSIRHVVPCGGEDLSAVEGPVILKVADGSERFDTVKDGIPTVDHPTPGEVVWADDLGVTCRAWNWRQGVRTRLTEATTTAYFLFDTLAPMSLAALHQAGDDLIAALQTLAPACQIQRMLIESTPQ